MATIKSLSAGLIAAALLTTSAMARTGHMNSRYFAEDAVASESAAAPYIDGRAGIPAARIGAFATIPTDGENVSCDVGDNPHLC